MSLSERRHQHEEPTPSQSASQTGDNASDTSGELSYTTPPRKRARNTVAEALSISLEKDDIHRAADILWRQQTLETQKEALGVQKELVSVGSTFLNDMRQDIHSIKTTVESDIRSMRDSFQSDLETMKNTMQSIVSLLKVQAQPSTTSTSSSSSSAAQMPSIPEEHNTPRSRRSMSIASSVNTTPTHRPRCTSRGPSQR